MSETRFYVHPTAVVDDPCEIGHGTRIWHFCHVMRGARIGADCVLGQNSFVAGDLIIGSNVRIQNNVSVFEGVELEDYVFCGPSCEHLSNLGLVAPLLQGRVFLICKDQRREGALDAHGIPTVATSHRITHASHRSRHYHSAEERDVSQVGD